MKINCLLFLIYFSYCAVLHGTNELEKANASYHQGESASTLLERKQAFNLALNLYLELEKKEAPNQTNRLTEMIGDTFSQLSEYAWAILYYNRALELNPRDSTTLAHLQLAQEQLGISTSHEKSFLELFLSFNDYFSFPSRLELFSWLILFTLVLSAFWFPFPFLKTFLYFTVTLVFLLLINLIVSFYFSPIKGILITPTGLYREPNLQQAQLLNTPLLKGIKVQILDVQEKGNWLKIETPESTIGYIPANSIRII